MTRAWRSMPARSGGGGSLSLRWGLGDSAAGMNAHLPQGCVTGSEVTTIELNDCAFCVHVLDRASIMTRMVSGADQPT